MQDDMKRFLKKNTLNQSEKYKLIEFLKANIARCNNKSSEAIAKFCNKDLKFPREDGKQIKIVAIHVDNVYQILFDCDEEVWTKKDIKKTFSIWELIEKIEKATTQIDSFREFYKIEFGDLCQRVTDIEIRLNPIGEDNTDIEIGDGNFDGTRDAEQYLQRVSSGS